MASSDARHLFVASFLSLFVELTLIRWIPNTVHVVGFFANLVLIASFLGIGIGIARPADRDSAAWAFLFRAAVAVATLVAVHLVDPQVTQAATGAYGLNEPPSAVRLSIPMPIVLLAVFTLTAWSIAPLGQLVGASFDRLDRIPAYSINVAGSLAGVVVFALASSASLPPEAWFGLSIAVLLTERRSRAFAVPIVVIVAALLIVRIHDSNRFRNDIRWSPYYEVVTMPVSRGGELDDGFVTDVNGRFLLSGLDLRPRAELTDTDPRTVSDIELLKSYYSLPFQLRSPGRVLVLGAGAGNDVAAALRNGAEHVTAVEIDPEVIELGRRYHPEHPFASALVSVVVDDARAFLDRSEERFDEVVFATLDAHGLLTGAANLRSDGFIYTIEALRAARDHLARDGVLVLSFGPFREDVQLRQYGMVRSLFGRDPIYLLHENGHRTLVAGATENLTVDPLPSGWRRITTEDVAAGFTRYPGASVPATDDWPHLYLSERGIPPEYVAVLVGILLISAIFVVRTFGGAQRIDGRFFFLGAGFLLMETRAVTEYALLAGSTWRTNALVFVVILATILIGNVYVLSRTRPPRIAVLYGVLIASLLATYVWPISVWHLAPGPIAYTTAAAYLGVPIATAAVIFAVTFRGAQIGSEALASNLIGAVFGGALEYLSLALGIRALGLVATAMYVLALAAMLRRARIGADETVRFSARSALASTGHADRRRGIGDGLT